MVLIQCQTKVDSLNGHYVSIDKSTGEEYETLDIVDSLVLINAAVVFLDNRDTIVIDTETKKFVRSTRAMFPIFDFKVVGDTIEIHFEHDAGQDKIKFIKGPQSIPEDSFSTSFIDVNLVDYDSGELIHPNDFKIKNLTIGLLKNGIKWGASDSIYIEFENEMFLQRNELPKLIEKLIQDNDDKLILCLNFDKRVPESMSREIREILSTGIGTLKTTESRNKKNEIVYVK